MSARALPKGLRKDLDLFAERVSQISVHRLVQEDPLASPSHLAAIICGYGGLPTSNPTSIAALEDRVDRIALNDLLRLSRLFRQQGERTRMFHLVTRALPRAYRRHTAK
jgi:hypothetical protein